MSRVTVNGGQPDAVHEGRRDTIQSGPVRGAVGREASFGGSDYHTCDAADGSVDAPAGPYAVELSVVIPAYCEQDNVVPLWEEVRDVLAPTGRSFEVIIVDDGSPDDTAARLRPLALRDPRLIVARLARNYGQSSAMAAGIHLARGRIIATLDGDRQNDPAEIPRMLERMTDDVDVVAGWRRKRQDKWLRSWVSRQANRIIGKRTGVQLHDYGCTLKLFRSPIAKALPLYGEMHRFIPAWARWNGARFAEVEVNHRPRVAGTSHYGLDRTFRVLLDLATVEFMTRYRGHATRFFGRWAWRLAGAAAVLTVAAVAAAAFGAAALWSIGGVLLAGVFGSTGLVLVACGILGELGWRMYFSLEQNRPFRIAEVVGGDVASSQGRGPSSV